MLTLVRKLKIWYIIIYYQLYYLSILYTLFVVSVNLLNKLRNSRIIYTILFPKLVDCDVISHKKGFVYFACLSRSYFVVFLQLVDCCIFY